MQTETDTVIELKVFTDIQNHIEFENKVNTLRNKIDNIPHNLWKNVRWIINDYDFVVKEPIINRAVYKYWEIIKNFDIYDNVYSFNDVVIHLAEAPGGFIQSTNFHFNKKKEKDKDGFISITKKSIDIITMSLNNNFSEFNNLNLPVYSKKIKNKNLTITFGKDNTGNVKNIDNLYFIKDLIPEAKSVKVLTCDGGFDEGFDFNKKEQLHYSLIINELLSALILLSKNGHFILKIYDIYTETTIHILYLLNILFEEFYIFKPLTSRPTNSEKYIICKNFKDNNTNYYIEKITDLCNQIKLLKNGEFCFHLFKYIPIEFLEKIKKLNDNIVNNQYDFLNEAIEKSNWETSFNKSNLQIEKAKKFIEWKKTFEFKNN